MKNDSVRLTLLVLFMACTGFLNQSLHAEEPLRWKWAEGDKARYLMTQSMKMSMNAGAAGNIESNTDQQMLMNWTVDKIGEEGEAIISQAFDRITMKTNGPMGQSLEYDSNQEEPPVGMATLVAPLFDALVKSPIIATMLSSGEYTDVELSDELAEAFKRMPGGAMSSDMVTQMTKQGSITFPAEAITVGETWQQTAEVMAPQVGKMQVTTTYTYNGPKEVEGKVLESFTPAVEMKMPENSNAPMEINFTTKSSSGEILFDRERGRIDTSSIVQEIDVEVTVQGQVISNQMTQSISMEALADGEEAAIGLDSDVKSMAEESEAEEAASDTADETPSPVEEAIEEAAEAPAAALAE